MPVLQILGAFGFMFESGGSALVSKTLGENNIKKANKIFSLLIFVRPIYIIAIITMFIFLIDLLYLAFLLVKLIQFNKKKIVLGQITYISGRDPIEYMGEHTPIINDNPHFVRIDGQAFFVEANKFIIN